MPLPPYPQSIAVPLPPYPRSIAVPLPPSPPNHRSPSVPLTALWRSILLPFSHPFLICPWSISLLFAPSPPNLPLPSVPLIALWGSNLPLPSVPLIALWGSNLPPSFHPLQPSSSHHPPPSSTRVPLSRFQLVSLYFPRLRFHLRYRSSIPSTSCFHRLLLRLPFEQTNLLLFQPLPCSSLPLSVFLLSLPFARHSSSPLQPQNALHLSLNLTFLPPILLFHGLFPSSTWSCYMLSDFVPSHRKIPSVLFLTSGIRFRNSELRSLHHPHHVGTSCSINYLLEPSSPSRIE